MFSTRFYKFHFRGLGEGGAGGCRTRSMNLGHRVYEGWSKSCGIFMVTRADPKNKGRFRFDILKNIENDIPLVSSKHIESSVF